MLAVGLGNAFPLLSCLLPPSQRSLRRALKVVVHLFLPLLVFFLGAPGFLFLSGPAWSTYSCSLVSRPTSPARFLESVRFLFAERSSWSSYTSNQPGQSFGRLRDQQLLLDRYADFLKIKSSPQSFLLGCETGASAHPFISRPFPLCPPRPYQRPSCGENFTPPALRRPIIVQYRSAGRSCPFCRNQLRVFSSLPFDCASYVSGAQCSIFITCSAFLPLLCRWAWLGSFFGDFGSVVFISPFGLVTVTDSFARVHSRFG